MHTQHQQKKLLNRAKRIRGQVDGIIRLLENKDDCTKILHTITSCRGAINSLMAELMEGHINEHVINPTEASTDQQEAATDLIYIIKKYLT
ncbi:metal/formaldehyde-sensitive transcriptional repressor [Piscirickettsia salmonis]|uniref:metal/formaldehyde-sensitive transcriptional repressor n=1 Tax=Piscirickettsia salmonis TaxID=1238 RepID=UPI0002E85400|nr:metal/formaldehyde-sensitive transcriptional repressor [Piscirickettsia salmonis]APS58469.1 transcriptional regulator [Piscirickettsia salmonis]ERL60416.1 metal-sensitive transcriptional repressor family protein [Piscirickettsia salmonis LF-89 = ATCC VR-1361]PEQ14851.1 metal/formaldehyde-sensitive transcriptional repressor [Piscirickettsia salmonis]QGN76820.1 Transcriptional repressor FrmR [Piscirickettsia salmonis]QGN80410.1 Transcriptional repressor FrmR [Piscirickettsia salmonis]